MGLTGKNFLKVYPRKLLVIPAGLNKKAFFFLLYRSHYVLVSIRSTRYVIEIKTIDLIKIGMNFSTILLLCFLISMTGKLGFSSSGPSPSERVLLTSVGKTENKTTKEVPDNSPGPSSLTVPYHLLLLCRYVQRNFDNSEISAACV